MSDNKFLHTIVAPNLTEANFGQSIKTQFENININFQRLVSAAYLAGQDGNDVRITDVPIYHDIITYRNGNYVYQCNTYDAIRDFKNIGVDNYNHIISNDYDVLYDILQQAIFTDFGMQLVECIFPSVRYNMYELIGVNEYDENVASSFNNTQVLWNQDLEEQFPSYSDDRRFPIWLSFVTSPDVKMFAIYDVDTDTSKNVCATQLYYFYDARIGSIQLLDDKETVENFEDYTSFIQITSNDEESGKSYTMVKSQDLPTLYYDNDAQEFCWKLNGIESNITAQGVKGDKGHPAGCWFCRGSATTSTMPNGEEFINVNLISYYTTNEDGSLVLREVSSDKSEITNGDFVCVDAYNNDTNNNATYFDTIFGNVVISIDTTGDTERKRYVVSRPYKTSVVSMLNSTPTLLYNQLSSIYGNGTLDALHGLFVPSSVSHNEYVHMLNSVSSDGDELLMLHPVEKTETNNNAYGVTSHDVVPTYQPEQKPKFIIEGYDVNINGKFSITDEHGITYTVATEQIGKITQNYEIKRYINFNYGAYIPFSSDKYYINGDELERYQYIPFILTSSNDNEYDLKLKIIDIENDKTFYLKHSSSSMPVGYNNFPLENMQLYIDILNNYIDISGSDTVITKDDNGKYFTIKTSMNNTLNRSLLWPFGIKMLTIQNISGTTSTIGIVLYFCNTPTLYTSILNMIDEI